MQSTIAQKCIKRVRTAISRIIWPLFNLEAPNFTRSSKLTATPDMTSPATSGQYLSKFEKKTAENTVFDGFCSNCKGPAFFLAQPIGGLLVAVVQ